MSAKSSCVQPGENTDTLNDHYSQSAEGEELDFKILFTVCHTYLSFERSLCEQLLLKLCFNSGCADLLIFQPWQLWNTGKCQDYINNYSNEKTLGKFKINFSLC